MNLKRSIGTIIGLLLTPFLILTLIISGMFTKYPDMECVAKPGCHNDCSKCSLYEPKAAYDKTR